VIWTRTADLKRHIRMTYPAAKRIRALNSLRAHLPNGRRNPLIYSTIFVDAEAAPTSNAYRTVEAPGESLLRRMLSRRISLNCLRVSASSNATPTRGGIHIFGEY